MKLGHALPTIQRAHNLHQDNRGIWVDLDVDYDGGIMLTIETMINLEYYLKQLTDQGKSDGDEVILKFSREDSTYSDVSSAESDLEDGEVQWDDAPTSFTNVDRRSPSVSSDASGSGGENANSDSEVDGDRRLIIFMHRAIWLATVALVCTHFVSLPSFHALLSLGQAKYVSSRLSTVVQLLFSFDQAMKVDKTLM